MTDKLTGIVIHPGRPPERIEIADTLEAMQATVGGYIEGYVIGPRVMLYMNEDGRADGDAPYCVHPSLGVLRGSLLILGFDSAGNNRSLSDSERAEWIARIQKEWIP